MLRGHACHSAELLQCPIPWRNCQVFPLMPCLCHPRLLSVCCLLMVLRPWSSLSSNSCGGIRQGFSSWEGRAPSGARPHERVQMDQSGLNMVWLWSGSHGTSYCDAAIKRILLLCIIKSVSSRSSRMKTDLSGACHIFCIFIVLFSLP